MRTSSHSLGDEIPDGYILPPDNYLKVLLYWLTIQEQVLCHQKIGSRATAEDPMAWFHLFITEMIYVWAGDFKNNLLEKNWSCAILMHNVQLQIDVSWRLLPAEATWSPTMPVSKCPGLGFSSRTALSQLIPSQLNPIYPQWLKAEQFQLCATHSFQMAWPWTTEATVATLWNRNGMSCTLVLS